MTPTPSAAELMACPFCGGTDIGNWRVQTYSVDSSYDVFGCNSCEAGFVDGSERNWNTRPTPYPADGVTDEMVGRAHRAFWNHNRSVNLEFSKIGHDAMRAALEAAAMPTPTAPATDAVRELVEALKMAELYVSGEGSDEEIEQVRGALAKFPPETKG